MSDTYLGEIRLVPYPFAPKGWALCDGSLMYVNAHPNLFAVLGTLYGGNGTTTFRLPDFSGRAPVNSGGEFHVGDRGGEAMHALSVEEIPGHDHSAFASPQADTSSPTDNHWAPPADGSAQYSQKTTTTMSPSAISSTGQGQAHDNLAPYLVLNFIIAVTGEIPPRD